ncbi:MAG: replication initiator protein A [Lachnospiraceae bacterium]|nr:replication initiator protein A [Lachnospiraceae bacterium]
MSNKLPFDYYYGIEAEQFAFYRLPRLLVKDERFKGLSSDAKILYGLMLDRMALSRKNGWIDEHDRAYIIYSIEDLMDDLGCSKPTCIKTMKELDSEKGLGLIERVRRGLGRPDIIYVKNFATLPQDPGGRKEHDDDDDDGPSGMNGLVVNRNIISDHEDEMKSVTGDILTDHNHDPYVENDPVIIEKRVSNTDESTEVKNLYFKKSKNFTSAGKESLLQEVKDLYPKRSKIFTSAGQGSLLQEVKDFYPNYTDKNNTDCSYTDINHIDRSGAGGTNDQMDKIDGYDAMDEAEKYMRLIRKNIDYDLHMQGDSKYDRELYDEMYHIICDIVCVRRKTVRINGEDYPYEIVKSRFLKLNSEHLEYVRECMKHTNTKIGNIKAYLLTSLYSAPETMTYYYQQEANSDLYGDG